MAILNANGVGKDFGDVTVIESVSFELQSSTRMGIVGANGTGKTTLIKMISGEYRPDRGSVRVNTGIRIGVLDQIPTYPDGVTVEAVLREAFSHLDALGKRMTELEVRMAAGDESVLREYGDISTAYDTGGGYDIEVELRRVANGLGIAHFLGTDFNRLSGGERTRINLARMILSDVGLMLLDEPTNHLDIQAVEWLEDYLNSYKGAALIISHDRYFLDRTVTKILELENLGAKEWEGNYSAYAYQKEEYMRVSEAHYSNLSKKIKSLEDTARRTHDYAGKNAKLHRRAFSMDKRVDRMKRELPAIIKVGKNLRASFGTAARSGEDVLAVTGLKKSFGERTLFSEVELEIKKDDRIALIGANGTGKTTLLRILLGELLSDEGRVKWGMGVKTAYLPQIVRFEYENTTLVDCVARSLDMSESSARNVLGAFHFAGEDVYKIVKTLSGGEKSRLRLLILMYGAVNMLILDEPTNHLDIRSREWIEQAMDGFDGTLLMVSHDRYFIERFATRIWSVQDGGIIDFDGGYSEFREYAAQLESARTGVSTEEKKGGMPPEQRDDTKPQASSKQREQDRKRLPILERSITRLEEHLEELDGFINDASSDHVRLTELLAEKDMVEKRLMEMIDEWTELSERVSAEG